MWQEMKDLANRKHKENKKVIHSVLFFFLIAAFQRAVLQHEQNTKKEVQVKALRLRQQQVLI